MTGLTFCGRWPVRAHLRPRNRCKLVTEADVRPEILRCYPTVVTELNCCPVDVCEGQWRPGRGWEGWRADRIHGVGFALGERGVSAPVIAFPQPVPGTEVAIVRRSGDLLLLSAPNPGGRRRTVHWRLPPGSLAERTSWRRMGWAPDVLGSLVESDDRGRATGTQAAGAVLMNDLPADREEIARFYSTLFRTADPGGYVSLRTFEHDDAMPPVEIRAVQINGEGLAPSSRPSDRCG